MARARRVGLGHEGMSTPAEGLCHRSDLFSNRPFLIVFQFAELDPRLVVGHPDDRAPQGDRAGVPLEYKGKIYLRTAGFDTRPVDTTAPQAEIREGLVQRDMRAKDVGPGRDRMPLVGSRVLCHPLHYSKFGRPARRRVAGNPPSCQFGTRRAQIG